MRSTILLTIALFLCQSVYATEAPSIVVEGFEAYKDKGAASGFETWLRGSALEGDTTTKLNVLGGITQIEAAYGKVESFEVIATFSPGTRLRRVYAVSYHMKGPVFSYFDLYKSKRPTECLVDA